MPRLRILYDADERGSLGGAKALRRNAPEGYEVTLASWTGAKGDPDLGDTPIDIVFSSSCLGLERIRAVLRRRGWNTSVVAAWSAPWPLDVRSFHEACRGCDLLIVHSHGAWTRMGAPPGTVWIPRGVDEVFAPHTPAVDRAPKVLWAGSIANAGSDGYYSRVLPLLERLRDSGVATDVLRFGSAAPEDAFRADWYNEGTVFISASGLEGSFEECLEAAACGCALVCQPVGNLRKLVRDGVNGVLVDGSVDGLYEGVQRALTNHADLSERLQDDIEGWSWESRAREFYAAFAQSLDSRAALPDSPARRRHVADLRSQVTVFVTTVGAPSYEACLHHLEQQDARVGVEVIADVAPMSAAFQAMIDRCRTSYYVQVDEDMLLYPHAVRALYEWIEEEPPHVAMCAGALLDAHLRRIVHGIKIFRHDIVRDFPHPDLEAFETHQLDRLAEAGFEYRATSIAAPLRHDLALGLHGTHWTPHSIFLRYATLERKRRRDPARRTWVVDLPDVLFERYASAQSTLADMTEIPALTRHRSRVVEMATLELYALLGWLTGSMEDLDDLGAAKDYRNAQSLPSVEQADEIVRQWAATRDPKSPTVGEWGE